MSRRRPVLRRRPGAVVLALTLCATALTRLPSSAATPTKRPNVMIILTDDQRADQTMDVMPKTRKWFGAQGTVFPNGYVTSPLCCPSRSTLMSGRYMHNHTVYDNGQDEKLDKKWTLARYLQDAGYTTAMTGKYLVGWPLKKAPPNYDRYALTLEEYKNATFNVNGKMKKVPYTTDFNAQITNTFIDGFEKNDARPWFMYVAPQAPHSDFIPSPKYAKAPVPPFVPSPAFWDDKTDTPPFMNAMTTSMAKAKFFHDQSLRTLMSVDDMVDSIMRRLKADGELDNTLVIFTSDNGYQWGELGMWGKGLPYTESIKVPFMVRWPGHVAAGARDDRMVSNVDLLPSILDAAGAQPPVVKYPFDGHSIFSSYARDESLTEMHAGYHKNPSWASIRTPDWFYAEYYGPDDQTVTFREYYDLAQDPYQLTNVLMDADTGNDPDVAALSARLAEYRVCAGTAAPAACP
jgi:arylsulfatase A-like enzyme